MQTSGQPPMPTLRVIDPRRARRQRLWLAGLWLLSLALVYILGRYIMIPDAGGLLGSLGEARDTLAATRQRLSEAEQRLTNLERSEQIARLANENVQSALAAKDTEITRLRRDLALYERLIGPNAERQGLSVYELSLTPADNGSVAFSAVLTQTRDVRRGSEGMLTLAVEGERGGRPARVDWPELVPAQAAEGLRFDFRYFQRLDGRIMLPSDFQPHVVRVRLRGSNGEAVERTLRWDQITSKGENDVQQQAAGEAEGE